MKESGKNFGSDDEVFILAQNLVSTLSSDTIDIILAQMPANREKAFALTYLGYYQLEYDSKLALPWIVQAMTIAKQLGDSRLLYWTNRHYAFYYKAINKSEEALNHFTISNTYAEQVKFRRGKIINLLHFAEIYKFMENYEKAFEYAFENLETRKAYDPDFGFGFAHYFLGELFAQIEDYPEAIKKYSEAETIFRAEGELNYSGVMLNAKASALQKQNLPDSALVVWRKAMDIFQQTKSNFFLGSVHCHLGGLQLSEQQFELALVHYFKADSLLKEYRHHTIYLETLQKTGHTYLALRQYDKAEEFLKKLSSAVDSTHQRNLFAEIQTDLSNLYLAKENFNEAKKYGLKARGYSNQKQQKKQRLIALQCLLQTHFRLNEYKEAEEIQKEISILSESIQQELRKKNIADLKLSYQIKRQRDELEKEKEIAIKEKKWNTYLLSILAFAFIIISLLLIHIIRITKKRSRYAEQALIQSEKRLSTIYNSSQDLIGLLKMNEHNHYLVESVNEPTIHFLIQTGLLTKPEDLIGMRMKTLFEKVYGLSDALVEERMQNIDKVFVNHQTYKYKSLFAPPKTEINLFFETIISPVVNAKGQCTQALYVARDITESENAKNKLLASEKNRSSVFNGTSDQMAIFDITSDGQIIFEDCNKSFKQAWIAAELPINIKSMYGKDAAFYMGTVLNFTENKVKERMELIYKMINDKTLRNYEENYKAKNNKNYLMDITISPIFDKENNCKKLLFVMRDITLKHKANEQLISKILETEDRERSRFSRELHDSLGQNLTAASLNFNYTKNSIDELNPEAQQKLKSGIQFLKEAINESRNIAHNLMPQSVTDFGLILTIENLIENLSLTTDIEFTFYDNLNGQRLSLDHELSLYRITQEAINNILKHAEASKVTIQLIKHPNSIIFTIEDNGKGFDHKINALNSFGFSSMKNRASALSGILDIESAPEKGTTVILEIPI